MKSFFVTLSILLVLALSSCHKDKSNPSPVNPPPPTNPTGTIKISLAMPADTSIKSCELIISETGGKVLLDTVTPRNTTINTGLSTNATLVDVTLITQRQYPQTWYNIYTYKAVNPASWTAAMTSFTSVSLAPTLPSVPTEIYYKHIPSLDFQFAASSAGGGSFRYSSTYDSMDVQFNAIPGATAYLLFYTKGLYQVHQLTGAHDTVNCLTTPYDTAVSLSYNPSPNYSWHSTYLTGIPDSTDPNKDCELYYSFFTNGSPIPQLIYPRAAKFQKYFLNADFNGTNEHLYVYSYTSSINTNINYPPEGAYTTGSALNTSFTVTFNAAKPTYYEAELAASNITWSLFASPDSTSLNPLALITAQKSKLLQGQDLSAIKPNGLLCETVPGYGFQDYFAWVCNPALHQSKPVSGSVTWSKGL